VTSARFALALILPALASPAAAAVEGTVHDATAEHRLESWREAVAVADDGSLRLAPSTVRLLPRTGDAPEARPVVWSTSPRGTEGLLVATGHDGELLRVGPGEEAAVLFTAGEPEVTAVLPGKGDDLLVATTPRGAIFRILADGRAELFALVEARYLWALAWDGAGRVLAAAGDPATLVRIDGDGNADVLFRPERESHLTALLPTENGDVLVSSDGLGRIYRVTPTGEATVVYDAPHREIAAMARDDDGTLWAVTVAERTRRGDRPRVRVRVPAAASEGRLIEETPGGTPDDVAGLWGEIEGLDGDEDADEIVRGTVVRLSPEGAPREVWAPTLPTPTAIAVDGAGRALVGTSEPARLYRLGSDGQRELLLEMDEGAVTHIGPDGAGGLLASTARPGVLYRVLSVTAERGTYHSRPLDGGAGARWGSLRWNGDIPAGGNVELAARSGDALPPGAGWSDWVPVSATPGVAPLAAPPGRYLQVRARLGRGAAGSSPVMRDVSARYRAANRRPAVTGLRLEPADGAGWRVRWEATDPDDDPLWASLEIADAPGGPWTPVASGRLASPHALTPEVLGAGTRHVRLTVSDDAANLPGEGATAAASAGPFLVDPDPPKLSEVAVARQDDGSLRVTARADAGPEGLTGAWVSTDDGATWWPAGAEDGVVDGPRDRLLAVIPASGSETVTVRVRDASGVEARTVARP
jgi:hypothetical protein